MFPSLKLVVGAAALAALAVSQAAAQEPIKIGILGPNTGPYAIIGQEVRNGFDLYFSQVGNKAGGRQVQTIYEDAEAKPDVGLTKAQQLVERDHVSLIAGVVSSSVAYALRDYVVKKNIPLVLTVASANGLTQKLWSPIIFRTNTAGSQDSQPLGTWLYKQGHRKLIVMAPNYAMGYEQTGGVARTFVEAGGKIVKVIYPPLGTSDYAPYLTSIDPSSADALLAVFAGSDALKFVKQFAEYGLKGRIPLVSTSLLTDDLILQQEGDAALGIITAQHYSVALDNPQNKAFVAAYEKKYHRPPTLYAESSYVGAEVIHDAIEKLKGNVSDVKALTAAMHDVDFQAPSGRFRFDDRNSPIMDIYIARVEREGGRLVNKPFYTFKDVSQFYTWGAQAYLKMPTYDQVKNDWVH